MACNVTLSMGGSMIWSPAFKTDDGLTALPDATAMMGVPTFCNRLLDGLRFDRALARQILAAFKRPKEIFIVAELPINAMGKVPENVLRGTNAKKLKA